MNKPIIFLVVISVLFIAQRSIACSCMERNDQGFYSSTYIKMLPKNAKGLLFTRYEYDETKPLRAADFLIVDETSNKKISAKVVKLALDFVPPNKYVYKVIQAIYRIEPSKPFIQGHRYTFTYKGVAKHSGIVLSNTVAISTKALSVKALSKATFKFIDKAEVRTIQVTGSGSCSRSIDALVQEIAYEFPPELKEFQDSILFFTAYSKDSKKFGVWRYSSSLCSPRPAGRSAHAFGHDLVYIPNGHPNRDELERGTPYSIKGTWIAPEIEDKLHSSKEYPLSYPNE